MTAADRLFMFLSRSRSQKKGAPEIDPSILADAVQDASKDQSAHEAELTAPELENSKIYHLLLKAVAIISGSRKPNSETGDDLDSIVSKIEQWLTSKNDSLKDTENYAFKETILLKGKPLAPSWAYLHSHFTLLETLKAVSLFLSFATSTKSKSTSPVKDKAETLRSLVTQVVDRLRANTRQIKSHISEPGVLGELVDLVIGDEEVGEEVGEIIDTAALEVFCGEVMESWEDGLDGVLNVVVVA
jgi:N-terminal acetyltransferase B complex non-catalytic subunit